MHKSKQQSGFTLVEVMVSVTIFAFVMTAAIGAVLTMVDANQKAQSLNVVMSNLNSALEAMSRNIRTGYDYKCFTPSNPASASEPATLTDCLPQGSAQTGFSFLPSNGSKSRHYYAIADGQIWQIASGDSGPFISVTGDDVTIETANGGATYGFYVFQTGSQPRVLLKLKGRVNARSGTGSTFYLQTTMSQRLLGQ